MSESNEMPTTAASSETPTEPFLVNRFGDRYLFSVNGNAFNALGAEATFRSHFGKSLDKEDTFYLVIGTDSGLLVEYVLSQGVPDGSRFLFIELPYLIEQTTPTADHALFSEPRIALRSPLEWRQAADELDATSYVFIDRVEVLLSIGASDARLPEYESVVTLLRQEFGAYRWSLLTQLTGKTFVDRELENLAEEVVPATVLRGAFPGKTAVVLAGGPSLDDVMPWVKGKRHDLVVIAVSRIARNLRSAGVVPDIVCTVDPNPENINVSREMLEFPRDVVLAFANHTYSPLVGQWRGRAVYLGERFPWKSNRENKNNIQISGPTVTNTAIFLAMEMGFAQIVFGGLDLCFSRSGHSHASHSLEHNVGPSFHFLGQQLRTNAGYLADTMPAYAEAAMHVQALATVARSKGCRFVNPAPGAAAIEGVDHVPLEDIKFGPGGEDVSRRLGELVPFTSVSERAKHLKAMDQELRHVQKRLGEIRELAKEGLRCNEGLFGRNGKPADFKFKRKMDRVEVKLDTAYEGLSLLVKRYGIRPFLRLIRPSRDAEWLDDDIEEAGRIYYESYQEGAEELLKVVGEARDKIRSRQEEDSDRPPLLRLCRTWRTRNEPGRALLWKERHPTAADRLSEEEREHLESVENAYSDALYANLDSARASLKTGDKLNRTPAAALIAFRNGDTERLERIVTGLGTFDSPRARQMLLLAQGYIEELRNHTDAAIAQYQQITDEILLEHSLRRIVALTVEHKDFGNALVALECLSQLSPAFMPQYADMLNLLGDTEAAVNVYAEYLNFSPDDSVALLKLGKIYMQNGVLDGALWAFRHVIERDPSNSTAKALLAEALSPTPRSEGPPR